MILQALAKYYENLAEEEKVPKPGWCSDILILDPQNEFISIHTPFAGVWIEIQNMKLEHRQKISLSS